ncbi:MAG: hypothetical protein IJJ15_06245 [Ruminococcus sp.]|nr:hypothetical protein [Ruminococcus sp.]
MTVRFDLTDVRERNLAEFMQNLDVKKFHSSNQFIIDALADYVDLQSITREQHEEDIRSIIREEMRACFAEANFAPQPVNPALSAEQQEETEQDILDDLKLFD